MSKTIKLRLNDALFNAGLLGFIRVCENCGLEFTYSKDILTFSSDILVNFTQNYLETLIYFYETDSVYYEILKRFRELENKTVENYNIKFEDHKKYITDKLKRASYISAYEIIKKSGECYPFEAAIKEIKETDVLEDNFLKLSQLIDKLKKYKYIFILKDITYTKIQLFWTNVAFLSKTQNKEDFHSAYEEAFTLPVKVYSLKEPLSSKYNCCQCQCPISGSEAFPMSWISDVGIDIKRKTSYYWNFNPDTYLCPVCNLIYSCIPLGFTLKGSEAIFINKNQSIDAIQKANFDIASLDISDKSNLYYTVLNRFINDKTPNSTTYEIASIQIIRRSKGQYYYNILSKHKLKVIKDCDKSFLSISKIHYTIHGKSINLYQTVLNLLLSETSLYPLINKILYESSKNNKKVWFVQHLIKIQTHIQRKGEEIVNDKINYEITILGTDLREAMSKDERNNKKITSLTFHLLNHLKAKNPNKFVDILLRQYMSLNLNAPSFLTDIFTNDENFSEKGYSFVAGLNSSQEKEDITS